MLIRNLVLALALLSLTACGEKEGKDGDSETNMSVKEVCQKVLDKQFSQSKHDEKREKEPEVFEKKKEYKVAKCVSKLTKKKEKHPEFFTKVAKCAAKHDEYKALDKCFHKASEYHFPKDGDSETNMSVEEVCQKVLDKKFSRSKYDEKREKEPEVFEKKKEYKVAKCVSKLTKKKEKHPEFFTKVAKCAAKHDEYKALDKCMDKASEYQRELSYAELLKKDKKSYESAKYGVELRAPTGGQTGDYNFLEYKEPYFTVELEQSKCGWSLQNDRERGGGPKATFDDEKWCARGESHIRQIAKGKAILDSKVTSVTSLPNGNGTYLVQTERKSSAVREGEEPSIVREIAVYLPRANDLVICKASRVDSAKELALAKEICSSLKPL